MNIINKYKYALATLVMATCFFCWYLIYGSLNLPESICNSATQKIYSSLESCSSIKDIESKLDELNMTYSVFDEAEKKPGIFRPYFHRRIISIKDTGSIIGYGEVRFYFINDKLSAISYFPENASDPKLKDSSDLGEGITATVSRDYYNRVFVKWESSYLEEFVRAWIKRFA